MYKVQYKKLEEKNVPTTPSQSTPALVSTILPQSISDTDIDQGENINETLKKVAQTFNQSLLMTTAGNPTSNLDSNKIPHDNTSDRQSAPTLNTNDIQIQTQDAYKSDPSKHINTN